MKIIEGSVCPPPKGYIAIVVARFNKSITQRLLEGALAKLREHKVPDDDIQVIWVPGAFEIPIVAGYFARDIDCLAVICLGAVIKGETSHDQHINRSVSMTLADIGARSGTPVIFGILTCNTVEQAEARSGAKTAVFDKSVDSTAGNKGAEAATAALEMIDLMTELPPIKPPPVPPFAQFLSQMLSGNDDKNDDNDDDEDDNDEGDFFEIDLPGKKRKPPQKKK